MGSRRDGVMETSFLVLFSPSGCVKRVRDDAGWRSQFVAVEVERKICFELKAKILDPPLTIFTFKLKAIFLRVPRGD
jgi:hypothetical protein